MRFPAGSITHGDLVDRYGLPGTRFCYHQPRGKPHRAEDAHAVDSLRCYGRNRAGPRLGNATDVRVVNTPPPPRHSDLEPECSGCRLAES
jgi:hypothetical protein